MSKKHKGSVSSFVYQRNAELERAYRDEIKVRKIVNVVDIASYIVNSPCSRFWVSEERAMFVVSAMIRERESGSATSILDTMRRNNREQFEEIYRRTMIVRNMIDGIPIPGSIDECTRSILAEVCENVMVAKNSDGIPRGQGVRLFDIVMQVVNSPAPKWYLESRCALEILYRMKRGLYNGYGQQGNR